MEEEILGTEIQKTVPHIEFEQWSWDLCGEPGCCAEDVETMRIYRTHNTEYHILDVDVDDMTYSELIDWVFKGLSMPYEIDYALEEDEVGPTSSKLTVHANGKTFEKNYKYPDENPEIPLSAHIFVREMLTELSINVRITLKEQEKVIKHEETAIFFDEGADSVDL